MKLGDLLDVLRRRVEHAFSTKDKLEPDDEMEASLGPADPLVQACGQTGNPQRFQRA